MIMPKRGDRFLAKSIVPNQQDQEVIFEGIQEVDIDSFPDFALYTLTKPIGSKHVIGSTLARNTLEDYGYMLESEAP
jgi:hypothetical protein